MELLRYHLRKLLAILRNEVLVMPSRIAVLVFFLVLLAVPLITDDFYLQRILIQASIFAIFAASWDLLSGFTGQVNFGHALFFGIGAYSAALLNRHLALPPWATIPSGATVAVAAGLIVGIPCLRLRGTYLALTTLAFPIILTGLVTSFPKVTGGELGIFGLTVLSDSRVAVYYIVIITMLVLCTIMYKITKSRVGIIFHAIREDELAVKASGINTTRYKLLAFCLSGFFAGISGGLYAHYIRVAGPSTLEVGMSFNVVIWSVFGGMATIWAPVGSVFILTLVMELFSLWPKLGEWFFASITWLLGEKAAYLIGETPKALIFSLIVLFTLLYMPGGLLPWLRGKTERVCPRCKIRNLASRGTCRVCAAKMDPDLA